MRSQRLLLFVSALLAIGTLGLAAAVLESVSLSSTYDVPTQDATESGVSVVGVLLLLLVAFLDLFGIELDPAVPAAPPHLAIEEVVSSLTAFSPLVLLLVAVAVVGTVVVLVGRRLPDSAAGTVGRLLRRRRGTETTPQAESVSDDWPPAEPTTDVSAAWVAMTESLEVDRPRSRTPGEWADAAVAAGFDEDDVAQLTRTFRDVRYGTSRDSADYRRRFRVKRELETIETTEDDRD